MTTIDPRTFREGSQAVVHGLRRALADVIASVGGDPSQPQEMSRRFGLDKTLAWRIARAIRQEDSTEAIRHLPRRLGIRIFLERMEKSGAPSHVVESTWQALAEFENFVQTHSGDRETLEVMVEANTPRASDKRMEAYRKSFFQAASAIWGVRARLQLGVNIMAPGAQEGMVDLASVCGLVDLRRLRPNVPWAISSALAWEQADGTTIANETAPVPLHPAGLINDVPVLPEFCSQPLPTLRRVHAAAGGSRFEITDGPVGNTASATVMLGWKWRPASIYWETSPDELGEHGTTISTPAEVAIVDLLVHRSLTFALNPVAKVYSKLPGGPQYPHEGRDIGLLPMPERVVDLGAGPPDTTTPEFPRYRELVEYGITRMGWNLSDFHAFRYRMRYPPIPVVAILQHPLLAR